MWWAKGTSEIEKKKHTIYINVSGIYKYLPDYIRVCEQAPVMWTQDKHVCPLM